MTIAQKREQLQKLYGPTWALKVEKMSDEQVAAVYMRHLSQTTISSNINK